MLQPLREDQPQFITSKITVNKGSGAMGFSLKEDINDSAPGYLIINGVQSGSAAANAGLLKDDYVLEVDGHDLRKANKLKGVSVIKEN